ncbi:MAG: type II secretion system protein [Gemmataceae bacterium]
MHIHPTSTRPRGRPGLTLMELLIVLTILSVMTLIAVQMTDGVIEQGRYDASQQGLTAIRNAISGPPAEAGVTGFVADMGRLPGTAGIVNTLDELLVGTPPFGPHGIDSDGDGVDDGNIFAGWRGPYVRSGMQGRLVDGWGNPFRFDRTILPPRLIATGSNGQIDASDLFLEIRPEELQAAVRFVVREARDGMEGNPHLDQNDVLELRLYRVMNGLVLFEQHQYVNPENPSPLPPGVFPFSHPENFTHELPNTVINHPTQLEPPVIGPMAVRAVVRNGATIEKRSPLFYLTLTPRAQVTRTLYLQ